MHSVKLSSSDSETAFLDELRCMFDLLDADKSGSISSDELADGQKSRLLNEITVFSI